MSLPTALTRRAGAALAGVLLAGSLAAAPASAAPKAPDLGASTYVFDPTMPVASIQATVDKINAEMVDNEMGTQRYALLFKPGTYGTTDAPLNIQVGYYTEVAGLGALPSDVVINGKVEVHNRCLTADNCIALNNFWRGGVQPHDQRHRRRRLLLVGELLGGVPGGAAAAREDHRQEPVADGLLHRRPAVRLRRLHRRLGRELHHQR